MVHDSTTLTRGELIQFIERGIENGSIVDVHANADDNSVTVQTIHSAKGLEYPIVIMANMNSRDFPPRSGGSSVIQYQVPVGLRQRKRYAEAQIHPHVYDNWRHDVLRRCLSTEYDEERRLLYVAVTRAEHHIVFASGEEPNTFLEELPVTIEEIEIDINLLDRDNPAAAGLLFAVMTPGGPIGHTPHSLMDEDVFDESGEQMEPSPDRESETQGMDFGSQVHEFAEAYALGDDVSPSNAHEQRVKALIDDLPGKLHVEEQVTLPLEVDGQQVTISGIADLVHETETQIEIIDYKTDSTRWAESEYRKQLSVYYHVLSEWFDTKDVTASLFYTTDGTRR